jgi:hypothetical protein
MAKNSPKTVAYLRQLATLKTAKNWTLSDTLEHLNRHLEGDKLTNGPQDAQPTLAVDAYGP